MIKKGIFLVAFFAAYISLYSYTPGIRSYTTKDYDAHQVSYDALFDEKGLLYLANAYGILSFDGDAWNKLPMAVSNSPIALCLSTDKKLYFGGNNDLGYAEKDKYGMMTYHSLAGLLPDSVKNQIGWVHHCEEYKGKIYFASEYRLYVFNGKTLTVTSAEKGTKFLFLDKVDQDLCLMQEGKGIGFLRETGTDWLKGDLKNLEIRGIEKVKENEYYLYGRTGIYHYLSGNMNLTLPEIAENIISDVVICGNLKVLATEQNGVYVLNQKFEVLHHFSATDGTLKSNYVYAVAANLQGDICVVTNNGVSVINLSGSINYIEQREGIEGGGYSSLKRNDTLYLGTSQGLFFSSDTHISKYQKIQGVQAFVRSLFYHQGRVFCSDQKDVYEISGANAKVISNNSWRGAWVFKAVPGRKDLFLVGTYSGIDVYKWNGKAWLFSHALAGYKEQGRTFEFDDNGFLWVTSGSTGLYRLQMDKDFTKVLVMDDYCKKLNLSRDYFTELVKDDNTILVASKGGIYKVENQYLMKFPMMEGLVFDRIRKIKDGLLYTIDQRAPLVIKKNNGVYSIDSTHLLNTIKIELIGNSEWIAEIAEDRYLVGTPDGFIIGTNHSQQKYYGKVEVRRIQSMSNDSLLDLSSLSIPYASNDLRFYFSFSGLENFYDIDWYVMLEEDGEGEWKKMEKVHFKEFTNLHEGDYVFKVKAVRRFQVLGESAYTFSILPPWYRTILAKIIYFLLIVITIYIGSQLWKKRLKRLEEKMEEEKKRELLIQENLHKAELLQKELQEKETELSFIALNYSQKKELFEHVSDKLEGLMEKLDDPRAMRSEIKGLEYSLNNSEGDEEKKWLEFQVHFNKEHNDYLEKIKAVDPKIKESMLLMCTYIRMGKSNKDICNLLNISINALDKRKSRLREKFNVPEEITLNEYLRQL